MSATFGNAMKEIISLRNNEQPQQVAAGDEVTLWRFSDGFEVIETNAGAVSEGEDGFEELKSSIMDDPLNEG